MLVDQQSKDARQGNLLSLTSPQKEAEKHRSSKLKSALGAINTRFGSNTVHYAGEGLDDKAKWRMCQNHRSPKYTSQWTDLPLAHYK